MLYDIVTVSYIVAIVLFILSLRGLSSPETALRGNTLGIWGMVVAAGATFLLPEVRVYHYAIIALVIGGALGVLMAVKAKMTSLPQMIALFNGFVGLAAVLLGYVAVLEPGAAGLPDNYGALEKSEVILGTLIGAVTFSGSMIAFSKLQGIITKVPHLKGVHLVNAALLAAIVALSVYFVAYDNSMVVMHVITGLSLLLGVTAVIMIGGADMPVVISMLNCYSGWAAAGVGFTMSNSLMIVTGALVGASGAILSYLMCKAMNRSLVNVLMGGFGSDVGGSKAAGGGADGRTVKPGSPEDASFIMKNAGKVVIVPGYGMAVAQAQHALREMADLLKENGVTVLYGVHPVAGRMPGHMNVLLAEANVPYEEVLELDDINRELSTTDVVYVIGANDVTNPLAKTDPSSPIFGMPILDVGKAKLVLFVKRSMASGYAGVDNPLFFADNTMMLFGDAKKVTETIVKSLS